MDDSPSMQAELRSAKAELVAATKELREVTAELEALKKEVGKTSTATRSVASSALPENDRFAAADSAIDCEDERTCTVTPAFLKELLGDELKLRKQARMRAVRDKGKITGFRIDQVKEGSIVALLGLQRADEIRSVAGVKLSKMGVFKDVIKAASRKTVITATVKRGKKSFTLRVNVE